MLWEETRVVINICEEDLVVKFLGIVRFIFLELILNFIVIFSRGILDLLFRVVFFGI